jgi:hypothetical protein
MFTNIAILSLTVASAANVGCPVFDDIGNLYLFSAASNYAISSFGAVQDFVGPSFQSDNLVCLPSFNLNAVFFLNADPAHPEILHSYFFGTKTWRNITMTGSGPDLSTVRAVLDYDTLVIYAFDSSTVMKRLGDASNENLRYIDNPQFTISWQEASNNAVPFNSHGYLPTFGHAFFNLYFFNVPGTAPGQVWGWRIHYAEWGPSPQSVQSDFPNTPGQTTTFTFKYPEQNEQ